MNIVITGASKGIGRQLAEHYAAAGHRVFGCSRSESDFNHENYRHFQTDVTDEAQVSVFAREVRREAGYVDALINNAGGASMNHFMLTPTDTADHLLRVNYLSAFACSRAFAGIMRKAAHPRIVNFTSVAVPLSLEGELAYVSAKAAVESLTKVMARELSAMRITVNAVGPAPTPTNLIAKVPREKLDKLLSQQAIQRFGAFEDVINVIDFYLSERSDFITGQIIYLGGIMR